VKTQSKTVAAFLAEILTEHVKQRDLPGRTAAHIVGRDGTSADIHLVIGVGDKLRLTLSDDTVFVIEVKPGK
jgi:hypothetical protein